MNNILILANSANGLLKLRRELIEQFVKPYNIYPFRMMN